MELVKQVQSYKPQAAPESPYLKAKLEWDERIGATVHQAKNWRLMALSSSALALALVGANITQIMQRKVIPMVVQVDRDSGETKIIGKAGAETYRPGEPQIRFHLMQFIKYVRTVPVDPVVIKANWLAAYKFLRPEAARTLNQITDQDEQSPLKKIGLETVSIQPISVLFVEGSNSYQARWLERRFDKAGQQTEQYTMTGLYTLEIEEPKSEEAILVNPLGIYIKSFQWSKDLGESK
jgi:type IV secretory pathway TrbF-like protein